VIFLGSVTTTDLNGTSEIAVEGRVGGVWGENTRGANTSNVDQIEAG